MSAHGFLRTLIASISLFAGFSFLPIDAINQSVEAQHRRGRRHVRVATYGHFYHPYYGFYYGPYYGYGYSRGYVVPANDGSGLRLLVNPRDTEVYIDGYFAGWVDDFDGFFQRLRVPAGEHEIILYHEDYQSVRQLLFLNAGGTFKVRHDMVPLAAGSPAEPRPEPPVEMIMEDERDGVSEPPPRGPVPEARTSARRTQPTPNDRFGVLVLRVYPGEAEIFIDEERWAAPAGEDDIQVHLPVGKHRVEIRRSGFESFSTEIRIRPNDETRLNVKLPHSGASARGPMLSPPERRSKIRAQTL